MIEYEIIRSKRKRMSLEITPRGQVVVKAPLRISEHEIRSFVMSKERWIEKHLSGREERIRDLGSEYTGDILTKKELDDLKKQAKVVLGEKVAYWEPRVFGEIQEERQLSLFDEPEKKEQRRSDRFKRITFGKQKTCWGSYTANGTLSLNSLLMLLPSDVQDYVVVHELCHVIHMNHSKRFWAEVERVLPSYKRSKAWLSKYGSLYLARLP